MDAFFSTAGQEKEVATHFDFGSPVIIDDSTRPLGNIVTFGGYVVLDKVRSHSPVVGFVCHPKLADSEAYKTPETLCDRD